MKYSYLKFFFLPEVDLHIIENAMLSIDLVTCLTDMSTFYPQFYPNSLFDHLD